MHSTFYGCSLLKTFQLHMLICIILESLALHPLESLETCVVPFCETSTNKTSELFQHECKLHTGKVLDRCCWNEKNHLVGLYLENCNLTSLEGHLHNYTDLLVLDLLNNELNVTAPQDFLGLVSLDVLFVDMLSFCPGKWKFYHNLSSGGFECRGPFDACVTRNVSCDDDGICAKTGPGSALCECRDGFYGYRCLRTGRFPIVSFAAGLAFPCLALSASLWFTQRRRVKVH